MLSPKAHPFVCPPWVEASQEVITEEHAEEVAGKAEGEEGAVEEEALGEEALEREVVWVQRWMAR